MKYASIAVVACMVLSGSAQLQAAEPASRPNIVFIIADDLGYADLGVQGLKDVPTPHIDRLANSGMRFTNAYASGCVCSPSRVGLLTGRYQQRSGHDSNPHRQLGLDLGEVTLAQRLKAAGYATGIVGKWHLGESEEQHPLARGFGEFYGILQHGIGPENRGNKTIPVYRGRQQVETPEDHTLAFGREAVEFVERRQREPFFLYLALTAVHGPHVAPQSYLERFANIGSAARRKYAAMLSAMDDQVGLVLAKLRERGLEENTLVVFMSDNGGPESAAVDNGPLNGGKWTLWEGGIRVPMFVQWKGRVPAGKVCDEPTIGLDLFPTAVAAAGVQQTAADAKLDGLDLLPLVTGQAAKLNRDALYWRFGVQYAVRQGDWKLVKAGLKDPPRVFNLASDLGEANDLSAERPQKTRELTALWEAWNRQMSPPRWQDERWNGAEERRERKQAKKKAS